MGRRVLRFDGPLGRGFWYRPSGDEFYNSAPRNGKPYNRADARWKCTPIPLRGLPPKGETTHYILRVADAPSKCVRCAPRRGKSALRSALGIISTSMHSTAKSSPSGGKVVPKVPKGVHFLRAIGAVVWFFLCYCPICKLSPPPSTKGDPLPQAAFITPFEPARSVGGTGAAKGVSPMAA